MNKEQWDKLDINTKLDWFITIFDEDLIQGFEDSREFDDAYCEYVKRKFDEISNEQLNIVLKEVEE